MTREPRAESAKDKGGPLYRQWDAPCTFLELVGICTRNRRPQRWSIGSGLSFLGATVDGFT
ncbi:hypothetical protein DPEC_G00148540 [Dallia pectoralis]|uniref:Uncharacterized protein n=1 Tax=Dallia pectoralis TaxID=75939 RepID=A0ACC2GIJ6_DALPE|nr:hypothetical protein DPEC_G00148540 [Dallia pectoralis]